VRVSRALEVYEQTGEKLSALRAAHARGADRYRSLFCVLPSPEDHDARIEARIDTMVELGWKQETASLLQHWPRSARAFGSVGYAQMVRHLLDDVPWPETRQAIRKATRIYARRQRTWFGGERGIDRSVPSAALLSDDHVKAWLAT
ncbi:MAG: tRNA dimethylallyltransferase, partial [Myxococcota bacterium]